LPLADEIERARSNPAGAGAGEKIKLAEIKARSL